MKIDLVCIWEKNVCQEYIKIIKDKYDEKLNSIEVVVV